MLTGRPGALATDAACRPIWKCAFGDSFRHRLSPRRISDRRSRSTFFLSGSVKLMEESSLLSPSGYEKK